MLLISFLSVPPFIIGVPGNIIIIIIANRKHNRELSPCIYMMAMAVVDAILLTISVIFMPLFFGTDLIQHFREGIFL
jgi:di/tricarboxylate transporter